MAIVGTAFVRLRVIGDKLKGDITDATKRAVNDAAPDLKTSGEGAGEHVGEGVGKGVERSAGHEMARIGDEIGNALGTAMGNSLGRSLSNRIGGAVRRGITGGKAELNRAQDFFKPVSDKFEKFFGDKSKQFKGLFGKALVSGISLAVIALPSALAFLGAAIGSVAATAITGLSALGPAAAGAGLTALAAFASVKIAIGLVGLALKTQTPELEAFQKKTQALKDSIGTQVQAGLLAELSPAVGLLQRALPALNGNLARVGGSVGAVAHGMALMVTEGSNIALVNTVLDNTTTFVGEAGIGVSGLAQAFLILLGHLGPITNFLGQLIGDIGTWAANAMQAAAASGALDSFISRMFDSLRQFVGIMVDFGVGIWNVFSAAHAASGGMLDNLQKNAAAFRDWTGDPANRDRMITFFEKARDITGQLLGVLKDLAGATGRGLESTNVEKFTAALNTTVSIGKSVGGVFEQIRAAAGDKLQVMFQNLANLLGQLASSGVIGTVTTALSNLFAIISTILNIPGVGQLLAFGAGLLVIFKTVSLLWTVLGPIVSILWTLVEVVGGALVAAFGWIPVVIGLVIAVLVWFFTQTKIGREIIKAVWDAIVGAFQWAWGIIKSVIDWIVGAFQAAWNWITGIAQGIWSAVSTAFQQIYAVVSSVVQATMQVFMAIWNAIWGFIQPILQGIWNVISTVFNAIVTVIQTVLNVIFTIWSYIWPLLALPIRILYGIIIVIWDAIYAAISFVINLIWTVISTVFNWIVGVISGAMNWIWGIISGVWNAIYGFISGIVEAIVGWIVDRWNFAVGAISGAIQAIWNWIVSVWQAIWGFIQPILSAIGGFISGIWNGIVDGVSTALNAIWSVIKTVWDKITGFIRGAMDVISGIIGGVWDFIAGVGSAVLDGIKAAVNFVIDVINTIIHGINWAIDLANHLPGPDIPHIPDIPRLAKGGVVSPDGGGTLAMIAEAGKSERVEPLDANGLSARDLAMIDRLSGSGSGRGDTVIYIGTRELTELVDFVVEDRDARLANQITTGKKAG
jgi:phage-related protein